MKLVLIEDWAGHAIIFSFLIGSKGIRLSLYLVEAHGVSLVKCKDFVLVLGLSAQVFVLEHVFLVRVIAAVL